MSNIVRFRRNDTVIVAIDLQERLMPAMYEAERTERQNIKLISGAKIMGIPVLATTQYSKGLGQTVPEVAEALGDSPVFDKTAFSAYRDEAFRKALEAAGRKTVVITGVESHVCVQQTALDLVQAGYDVALAADCVSSRAEENARAAELALAAAGVCMTCAESVLFELLENAKAAEFKQISAIIK